MANNKLGQMKPYLISGAVVTGIFIVGYIVLKIIFHDPNKNKL